MSWGSGPFAYRIQNILNTLVKGACPPYGNFTKIYKNLIDNGRKTEENIFHIIS